MYSEFRIELLSFMKQRNLYQRNAVNWAKVILYINVKLSPPLKIPQLSLTAKSSMAASYSSCPQRPSEHLDSVSDLSSHLKSNCLKMTKFHSPSKNNCSHKLVFPQIISASFWGGSKPGSAVRELYFVLKLTQTHFADYQDLSLTLHLNIFKRMLWTWWTTLMNHSVMHQQYVHCSLIRWQRMTFHRQLILSNMFCLMKTCGIFYFINKGQLIDIWWKKHCVPCGRVRDGAALSTWVHVFSYKLIHVAGHQPLLSLLPVEEVGVYFH